VSWGLFYAIAGLCFVLGLVVGRWRLALVALALWVIGLAIPALLGAYQETSETTAFGVFAFAVMDSSLWVIAVVIGITLRRVAGFWHWKDDDQAKKRAASD
jgi:urea transporter